MFAGKVSVVRKNLVEQHDGTSLVSTTGHSDFDTGLVALFIILFNEPVKVGLCAFCDAVNIYTRDLTDGLQALEYHYTGTGCIALES